MHPSSKRPTLLHLPLSPSLAHHLTPDPFFPTVTSIFRPFPLPPNQQPPDTQPGDHGHDTGPSYLRRSRQVGSGAHFTHVTPLVVEFPYRIVPPPREDKNKVTQGRRNVDGEAVGDGPKARDVVSGHGQTTATEDGEKVAEEEEEQDDDDEEPPKIDIESYLSAIEPSTLHPVSIPSSTSTTSSNHNHNHAAFTSRIRSNSTTPFSPSRLLAISPSAARECFPTLDVDSDQGRNELRDVISGRVVIGRLPREDAREDDGLVDRMGWAPYAMCYGGHQFGVWAGQLGDGRAITVLTTPYAPPSPSLLDPFRSTSPPLSIELQLKGSGRTPYSRFADGLAVLRSSVREFLGAEAMAGLNIPTSRAIGLVGISGVKVQREETETAAVVGRVSSTWVRIGNFEIQHYRKSWSSLAQLTSYTAREIFGWDTTSFPSPSPLHPELPLKPGQERRQGIAERVLREVASRNARMVAAWQVYGFMHGVMNTDNMSVAGVTIDYGPFAFMDVFNPMHICNHSDGEGRYSYRMQPTMTVWAIQKLGSALAEAIGYELATGQLLADDWAANATKEQLDEWREEGMKIVEIVIADFVDEFLPEFKRLLAHRLGLPTVLPTDFTHLFDPLLDLLHHHELDFSSTFRTLCSFTRDPLTSPTSPSGLSSRPKPADRPVSERRKAFLKRLVPDGHGEGTVLAWKGKEGEKREEARGEWHKWLEVWSDRIAVESETMGEDVVDPEKFERLEKERQDAMRRANPRFVLRQWVLEEVIQKLREDEEGDGEGGKREGERLLRKVLEMAEKPFERYGEPGSAEGSEEERRLCGMGERDMLGFQCSCSS